MTRWQAKPEEPDALLKEAARRSERHRRGQDQGEASVAHLLAQIGVLGWIIVVPTLLGLFAGRWLDRIVGSGLFFTAPLLMLGLALGCWSAWKWMHSA
ncbi:AtpZ/AtpI family protein [Thiomonas sp. FB-Cd]|uniref:AtpZ/AtpI family protein n=1 Tax=Thiomonas sp. FB-Cd TaxID=1158292 RepID=UPI0004DFCD28|nr:AtpZ/AtpI family protein [Thiomonas sp. FB-Cd]